MAFDFNPAMAGGIGDLLGGLFGGNPYKDAMKQYQKYAAQSANYQNPFFQAGAGAIPQFQEYLQGMSDPSQFINNLMNNYQESPYAKYQQQQSMRSAQNMGSATGLSGSTPLTKFAQENAANISSGDVNKWLQNVLGINQQYGSGLQNLLGMGQGAGSNLSNIFGNLGNQMAEGAFGSAMNRNNRLGDIFGGLGNLAMFAML